MAVNLFTSHFRITSGWIKFGQSRYEKASWAPGKNPNGKKKKKKTSRVVLRRVVFMVEKGHSFPTEQTKWTELSGEKAGSRMGGIYSNIRWSFAMITLTQWVWGKCTHAQRIHLCPLKLSRRSRLKIIGHYANWWRWPEFTKHFTRNPIALLIDLLFLSN